MEYAQTDPFADLETAVGVGQIERVEKALQEVQPSWVRDGYGIRGAQKPVIRPIDEPEPLEFSQTEVRPQFPEVQGVRTDCCNREVTEISTMTLSGIFTVDCGDCTGSCGFSRSWTRINQDVDFDPDLDQFKLYFGTNPPCQLFAIFNQPDFLHPVGLCIDDVAIFQGSTSLTVFETFPDGGGSDTGVIVMQFQVALARGSGTCVPTACNGFSDEFIIPYSSCDVSGLFEDRVFVKVCGCVSIEGHVVFS